MARGISPSRFENTVCQEQDIWYHCKQIATRMSSNLQRETRVQEALSPGSAPNVRQNILQQLRGSETSAAGVGHAFQPSSARLRQAAAQALARSHSNRSVTRIMSSISQQPGASTRSSGLSGTVNPSIHPQFRSKAVCQMFCNHCSTSLCERGMRAILLGNTAVELFSTDRPPFGVALVDKDYFTKNCHCRIRDAACLGCGNVVGYHVTHPCDRCLEACNNGSYSSLFSRLPFSNRLISF